MRISDWSADVCSSDLRRYAVPKSAVGKTSPRLSAVWSNFPWRYTSPLKVSGLAGGSAGAMCGRKCGRKPSVLQSFRQALSNSGSKLVVTRRPADRSRRSEEHPSELQSLMRNSYAVFCLKNKNTHTTATDELVRVAAAQMNKR